MKIPTSIILHIENMVCQRCVLVVENLCKELNIEFKRIE